MTNDHLIPDVALRVFGDPLFLRRYMKHLGREYTNYGERQQAQLQMLAFVDALRDGYASIAPEATQ